MKPNNLLKIFQKLSVFKVRNTLAITEKKRICKGKRHLNIRMVFGMFFRTVRFFANSPHLGIIGQGR